MLDIVLVAVLLHTMKIEQQPDKRQPSKPKKSAFTFLHLAGDTGAGRTYTGVIGFLSYRFIPIQNADLRARKLDTRFCLCFSRVSIFSSVLIFFYSLHIYIYIYIISYRRLLHISTSYYIWAQLHTSARARARTCLLRIVYCILQVYVYVKRFGSRDR